uniref:Uncharacterized protein n=1 Tax=Xenopus tropicalis TaxID=8364 RepID=A0A1B8XT49_XENTR
MTLGFDTGRCRTCGLCALIGRLQATSTLGVICIGVSPLGPPTYPALTLPAPPPERLIPSYPSSAPSSTNRILARNSDVGGHVCPIHCNTHYISLYRCS